MRQPTAAEQRTAHPRVRRLTGSVLVLLIVLLPGLLAFVRIDDQPAAAEIARVEQAVFAERAEISEPMQMFYGAFVAEDAPQRWGRHQVQITVTARVAGMLALFCVSALVYLLLLLVRGRATAVAGCLALCLLPPVVVEGHVLRPEQCATVFGLLGVVLVAGFPLMLQDRRPGWSPWLAQLGLLLVVGITFGVARSCQRGAWIYLAVPAAALLLSVLTLALMLPRGMRGKSWWFWPMRAAARRYVPWMFLVIASFVMTLWMLAQSGGRSFHDTQGAVGLLPANPWVAGGLCLLAGVGALRMGLGVALRLNRLRRVRADAVLFLYVAALMMQHFLSPDGIDRLPTAPALACLVGDGTLSLAVVWIGRWARSRRRLPAAAD